MSNSVRRHYQLSAGVESCLVENKRLVKKAGERKDKGDEQHSPLEQQNMDGKA